MKTIVKMLMVLSFRFLSSKRRVPRWEGAKSTGHPSIPSRALQSTFPFLEPIISRIEQKECTSRSQDSAGLPVEYFRVVSCYHDRFPIPPPTKTNAKMAVIPTTTARTRFIFPYPIESLKAPLTSGPTVRPSEKTKELNEYSCA